MRSLWTLEFEGVSELAWVTAIGSTILIGLTFFVAMMMRRSSASIRFAIWQTMFFGLMIFPVLAVTLPRIPLGWQIPRAGKVSLSQAIPPDQAKEEFSEESTVETETHPSTIDRYVVVSPPPPMKPERFTAEKVDKRSNVQAEISNAVVPNEGTGKTVSSKNVGAASPVSILQILLVVWMLGFVGLLIRLVSSRFRMRSIVSSAIRLDRHEIAKKAGLECDELEGVEVYLSNQLAIPVATGILSPKILLPVETLELKRESQQMVIRHELAHLRRRDILWHLCFSVVTALYWFQPLVWLASRMTQREREQACDDFVLLAGGTPESYASLLLGHAAKASGRQIHFSGAIPMAQPPLEKRLVKILNQETCRRVATGKQRFLFATLAALLVFGIGAVRPFASRPAMASVLSGKQEKDEGPKLPAKLSGKIVDEKGKPLSGVRVELQFVTWEEDSSTLVFRRRDHKEWTVVTGEEGIYTLNTKGVDLSTFRTDSRRINFVGWASAKGRVSQPIYQSGKYTIEKQAIRTIALPVGRKISGRVVAAEGSDRLRSAVNPRVRVSGPNFWMSKPIRCDEQGFFFVDRSDRRGNRNSCGRRQSCCSESVCQ